MKALFTTVAIAFGVCLLGKQPTGVSQVVSTPAPGNQLVRDIAPFPNFFQEGLKNREKEIHLLLERQDTSTEPLLKNNVDSQAQLERLPQIQPSDFPTADPSQVE